MRALLDTRPVIAGLVSTATGWSAAAIAWLEAGTKIIAFAGACFGTAASVITFLIVLRNYQQKPRRHK